jgi:hypothetical protein
MLGTVELPAEFDVVLGPETALDPLQSPTEAAAALRRLADAGATIVMARVVHESLAHYLEQLEALAAVKEET